MSQIPRRKLIALLASSSVAAFTGCSGTEIQNQGEKSQDTHSVNNGTKSPTATPIKTTIPKRAITKYSELSEEGKVIFEKSTDPGGIDIEEDQIPQKLWDASYVSYNGDVYNVTWTDTGRSKTYSTLNVEKKREVSDSADIIKYDQLTDDAKQEFKKSLENNGLTKESASFADQLTEYDYVEYESDPYEILITVYDVRIWNVESTVVEE